MPDPQQTQTPAPQPSAPPQQTLAQLVKGKYPGSYDDMDDVSLEKAVLAKHPEYSDLPRTSQNPMNALAGAKSLSAPPPMFSKQWFKEKGIGLGLDTADALPGAGATAGAVAAFPEGGPVASVGGAGIGGMGGEAGRQLMYRALGWPAPKTSAEAANQITKAGATQGIIQGVTEGLPFLKGPLQRAATSQYERALAPTTKINKAITQDITPELIQRGQFGSLEGLEKKAGQKIGELGPQLNQAYQQAPATLPGAGTKVIQDLEALKQSYMPGGNVAQPQAVNAIEGVQGIVKQYGPDVDPTTLRRLRQIFEDPVAQRGGFAGADLSTNYTLSAQKQAADSIRGILNKNPDIGALNKEISFWLDVQRVTSQSGLRRTGQEGGLMKVLGPLGAAVSGSGTGAATHSPVAAMGAAGSTLLATYGVQAVRSPLWRTMSAVTKDRFAQALASGDVGQVTALLARFGVAGAQGRGGQGLQANPRNGPQGPSGQPPSQPQQ